jgi:hypothetical protein
MGKGGKKKKSKPQGLRPGSSLVSKSRSVGRKDGPVGSGEHGKPEAAAGSGWGKKHSTQRALPVRSTIELSAKALKRGRGKRSRTEGGAGTGTGKRRRAKGSEDDFIVGSVAPRKVEPSKSISLAPPTLLGVDEAPQQLEEAGAQATEWQVQHKPRKMAKSGDSLVHANPFAALAQSDSEDEGKNAIQLAPSSFKLPSAATTTSVPGNRNQGADDDDDL